MAFRNLIEGNSIRVSIEEKLNLPQILDDSKMM